MYGQLTMPLFVSGYIVIMDTVKSGLKEVILKHLQELMADAARTCLPCGLAPAATEWVF